MRTMLLAFALAAFATAAPAAGCARWQTVVEQLADRYGEAVLWTGLAESGLRTALFVAPGGGTWTAVQVRPDGIACIVATGTGWVEGMGQDLKPGEEG